MDDIKLPRVANSLNDKVLILQARDKYVRSQRTKQTDIETAEIVSGNCEDMCYEYERYCRIDRNQVSTFEKTNGQPDEHKMVKEYVRSGADQEEPLPYELRPPHVLERTMLYLAVNIFDLIEEETDISSEDYYDFLWSRLRAIKKDITQQDLKSPLTVQLMERCARFHIYAAHRFIEEEAGAFDAKMNNENLVKTMQSLKDLYDDLSVHNNLQFPNEPEFRCYDILLNLGNHSMLSSVSKIKSSIRNSEPVQFALKVHRAYDDRNFVKFFDLLRDTTLLNACIMHRYFANMRYIAFQLFKRAYTTPNARELIPRSYIFDLLSFEDDNDFENFCNLIEIEYDEENVVLQRDTGAQVFLPNTYQSSRSLEYIDGKRGRRRLSEIIYHEPLGPDPYKRYPIENSFDENGQLKAMQIRLQDDQSIAIDPKKVYSFAESSGNSNKFSNAKSVPDSSNKQDSQVPQKTVSNPFGVIKNTGLFSQNSGNIFAKQSSQQTSTGSEQNIFRKNNLFGAPPNLNTNSMLNTNTNANLFASQTSTSGSFGTLKQSTQDQAAGGEKSFHFKIPANLPVTGQLTSSSLFDKPSQSQSSLFSFDSSDRNQKTDNSSSESSSVSLETQNLKKPISEPQLSEEELSSLSATILQSLMDDVIANQVHKSILNVLINDLSIQFANNIMNDVISKLTEDLCSSVYEYESKKQAELDKIIQIESEELNANILNEVVQEIVKSISHEVYFDGLDTFINSKSQVFADSYFEETLEQLIFDIALRIHQTELEEHRRIVHFIRERRGLRLAGQCFRHWKRRCDHAKRYRFLRDNFPASRMENSPPTLKRILSVPLIIDSHRDLQFKRKRAHQNDILHFSPKLNSTIRSDDQTAHNHSLKLDLTKESQIQDELKELQERFAKRTKMDELSTRSKLDYARRTLDSLKKVSITFNRSLDFVRPFLSSSSGHLKKK